MQLIVVMQLVIAVTQHFVVNNFQSMKSINDRIRERRTALKLSQERIAAELGISYQAVQKWEKPGGATPRRKRMQDLARLLQTTVAWLETGNTADAYSSASRAHGRVAEPAPMPPSFTWPFNLISIDRLAALSPRELGYIEGRLIAAIEECESTRPAKQQTGRSA